MDTVAKALAIPMFDEDVFDDMVDHIDVTGLNLIRICFKDGTSKDAVWHDRSRKSSWTPEMNEQRRLNTAGKGVKANGKSNMHPADEKPHHINANCRHEAQTGRRICPCFNG